MALISPWGINAKDTFNKEQEYLFSKQLKSCCITIHCITDCLWLVLTCESQTKIILRVAYSPGSDMHILKCSEHDDKVVITAKTEMGKYTCEFEILTPNPALIHYKTTLEPAYPLSFPFWPRDMVITYRNNHPTGKLHVSQVGARTGLQFLTIDTPKTGNLLYLQNLTALNDYCEATETSAAGLVGGTWPELGFTLPCTKENYLPAGQKFIVADTFLIFDAEKISDEIKLSKKFIDLLAAIYLHLPKPETKYINWLDIVEKELSDLQNNHGNWMHEKQHDYLNAYVSDYTTPPEVMVQLAALMPMIDYKNWSGHELLAIDKLKSNLHNFYDEEIGSIIRWLPSLAKNLDESEEQLNPDVMDSWYLNYPLFNLSRLALQGNKTAEKLFIDSLPFTIKVARHFCYEWPVFYNIKTLEVIKAETKPGEGGENDVAGLYALVMYQAFKLTKNKLYLNEAKKSAKTLHGKGFNLFYQANNTGYAADAMFRLYKETKDESFLDLMYLCLANIFKNLQLWECNYGYAKNYSTFFGVFPLNDAPYTAAYEEQEVFSTMHNFFKLANEKDLSPSVNLLLAEFIKYILNRIICYYPPALKKDMLCEQVTKGSMDASLWIALEDIHDGWEKSGSVGQEVYGAGVAFGIVPRHYHKITGEDFYVFIDYPAKILVRNKMIYLTIKGSNKMTCRLAIINISKKRLYKYSVTTVPGNIIQKPINESNANSFIEYKVCGGQKLQISWK